eukprot:gb/GECH01001697.1/.p1 GENE.gb/GECH01001697.1/~~gb/GECH01001697.1/.p1  ORF type:complete len:382 (+),score=130.00 gb/GECH01001697.1/:1-1146(+)
MTKKRTASNALGDDSQPNKKQRTSSPSTASLFQDLTFMLSGRLCKTMKQFKKEISKHGGSVAKDLSEEDEDEYSSTNTFVIKAKKKPLTKKEQKAINVGFSLLDENFILDSIKEKELQEKSKYLIAKGKNIDTSSSSANPSTEKESNNNNDNDNSQSDNSKSPNNTPVSDLFEKYKKRGIEEGGDEDIDAIQGMGLVEFAEDIELDPEESAMMVFIWKLQCQEQYQINRQEFNQGMKKLKVKRVGQLRKAVQKMREEFDMNDYDTNGRFNDFYSFVFNYGKAEDARSLPADMAIAFWKIVFLKRWMDFPLLEEWCQFIEDYGKAISKDTWNMVLEFAKLARDSYKTGDTELAWFDTESAWPSLIDDFVEKIKHQNNNNNNS